MKRSNKRSNFYLKVRERELFIGLGPIKIRISLYMENPFRGYNWIWDQSERFYQVSIPMLGISIQKELEYWEFMVPNWVLYWIASKERMQAEYSLANICSDPMNGCPGDFAEDFHRRHRGDEYKIEYLEYRSWKLGIKIANHFLNKMHDRLEAEYNDLPWNQGWDCVQPN